ncbi:alpha/beta hydrolase [Clostridium polynesiense]|uniref:alpha/beta hydrolase n=1 Tax=Clostridium polynesiense TaxID=1325933 RepID=UPI00058FD541|nr:alpha/beta hydrolase [Clostridium polynesiense]
MVELTVIILVLCILSLIIYEGYKFSTIVTQPKTMTHETTYSKALERGNIDEKIWTSLDKKEVKINSPYGYNLNALYFPNDKSKKAVIIVHGITWTLYGSVKYMDIFLKRGFSVLIYDHRNHGKSGGTNTSFGYYEKYDLKACADWLFDQLGKDAVIGVHGESMGAATVLQYSAIDPRIKFCIEDCGYSDATELFTYRLLKDYHIKSSLFVKLASYITKVRTGWSFKDVSPIKLLKDLDLPILFIHGDSDDYVPTKMCVDMYEEKKGIKYKYIAPCSAHADSYNNNKEEYESRIDEFLKDIHIL